MHTSSSLSSSWLIDYQPHHQNCHLRHRQQGNDNKNKGHIANGDDDDDDNKYDEHGIDDEDEGNDGAFGLYQDDDDENYVNDDKHVDCTDDDDDNDNDDDVRQCQMGCKAPTADGDTLQKFRHGSTCVHLSFVILVIIIVIMLIVDGIMLTSTFPHCLTCVHQSFVILVIIIVIMLLMTVMTVMKTVESTTEANMPQ